MLRCHTCITHVTKLFKKKEDSAYGAEISKNCMEGLKFISAGQHTIKNTHNT